MYLEHFCSADNGWKIPECFFACLDNFVTYAKKLDFTVIFDFHNNTVLGTSTPENIEETLIPIWTQMTGAMSGLSVAVTGLITVIMMPLFANLI